LWRLRTRSLELGRRTLVMGVVNLTPDSFSDGGRFFDPQNPAVAIAHCLSLLDEGADILDLGAESTRPGAHAGSLISSPGTEFAPAVHPNDVDLSLPPRSLGTPAVSAEEEQARLMPVLRGVLAARPKAIVSVDTYKTATARAALDAGAEIVNDVSGFEWEPGIADVCAEAGCGVVLMHTRGRPEDWHTLRHLASDELIFTVRGGLEASLSAAVKAGIQPEATVLDPGYGFGKRYDENYALLDRQAELLSLGRPLLAGLSRKSFLGRTLAPLYSGQQTKTEWGSSAPVNARETASIAALVAAILHGASIVRVHAVRSAVEAALIADAIVAAG
jgi:dihydropteroate synthase